jgi:hypothetical protein
VDASRGYAMSLIPKANKELGLWNHRRSWIDYSWVIKRA